jgi:hypothetical protein
MKEKKSKKIRLKRTGDPKIKLNRCGLIPYLVRSVVAGTSYYEEPPPSPAIPGQIDPGVRQAVKRLREHGIETVESCEGGPGHAYPEPTVAFYGTSEAGWRAVSVCIAFGFPILSLRRVWDFIEPDQPTGPHWEITFSKRTL